MAAVAFTNVFAGATVDAPVRESHRIDEVVAWMAGISLATGLLGTVDGATWQLLQPYVLESVCLWEQARSASTRTPGGDRARVICCLLRRGEGVLGSSDPVRTLRELLDGVELR